MQYRNLGASGLKVSAISFGTWLTFGLQIDDKDAQTCIDTSFENGINFFDTADIYKNGQAEIILGRCLAAYQREDYVLATKTFFPMSTVPNSSGLSRKHIIESCNASLKRLNVDYIDVFQCHSYDHETPPEETIRAMGDLIRQGKILYWGVSQWTGRQIVDVCELTTACNGYLPISSQTKYHLIDRRVENSVIPYCEKLGIGQIIYSPLEQGLFTGKYCNKHIEINARGSQTKEISQFLKPWLNQGILRHIAAFNKLSDQTPYTSAQLALAWVLQKPGVSSVICGATQPQQIVENIKAVDISLDDSLVNEMEQIFYDWKDLLSHISL